MRKGNFEGNFKSDFKGIFFDAADVFYRRAESTIHFALRLVAEAGGLDRLSPADELRLEGLHFEASKGSIGHEQFWHAFLSAHGVTADGPRSELVKQIGEQARIVQPIAGAHESVKGLKARGFLIGIVTDTIYPLAWKMDWLEQSGVAEFVDVVSCSSDLGLKKPDPAIYLDAVRKAGLTVAESAFVGHDSGELAGAHRAGLATVAVLYEPAAQADYYATTLMDLLEVPIFRQAAGRGAAPGVQRR
jgi:FMN phosphatase YigB (HAD superfamily)